MGNPGKAPKLFSFLGSKNYDAAANEFADITNDEIPGLVRRRRYEINIFKNDIYNNN